MAITFKEAMTELSSMFGSFDREMIKSVLVANNGDLDKTIEDLLKISEDATKVNPQSLQEDDDDNLFSNLTSSSTKNTHSNNDHLFSIDDTSPSLSPVTNFSNKQSTSKPVYKNTVDDSMARRLQEEADEEYARKLQDDILADAQTQSARNNKQQQKPNENMYNMKQDFVDPEKEEYPFEDSEEDEEQSSGQQKPKDKKPGFTTKLKSAFGGLFKKKKKNSQAEAQPENPSSKSTAGTKDSYHDPYNSTSTSQSKSQATKKVQINKDVEKLSESNNSFKPKPQTGDEEIYTFYFEGPPKYRYRAGFHQFNGQLEEDNKENPVEFIVTDLNKNGYSNSMHKTQKSTNIDSEFFNFESN